ncbi:MAG: alginate export family protein [Planctomycetes bacterium]|nr:alginate export family protein [Planctomycetota bacterium]
MPADKIGVGGGYGWRAWLPRQGWEPADRAGAMRFTLAIIATYWVCANVTPIAWGQDRSPPSDAFLQQQRAIDDHTRAERQRLSPADALLDWKWGGWTEYYLFHFDDGVQSSRVFQRPGMAVWSRLTIDGGAHELFARARMTLEYFNRGDEYERRQDWVGPNFDRAWYQIDVGRALHAGKPSDPFQLQFRIGRQAVVWGTGYALDLPLDAVRVEAALKPWRVTGLFGKTIARYPNVDRSNAVHSHSGRHFYGVQLTYDGFEHHQPFVYALWNQDHTDERPQDWFQEYSYDTQYFGVGSRGELSHALNYWAEGVFECGHSYGNGQFHQRDYVEAYGWDLGLEYLFDVATRPRISFEYMFGSGDQDRLSSPTNALGGNRHGRQDSSFVSFGYRDTGIAVAPVLSNLHVWRLGGSFVPLDDNDLFRDLEVGTNWFLYHKNRSAGAISDVTANQFDSYVGWEMDYFVNWRFASDLSWTTRWGVFFPGKAYTDRETRHFVFTGITWSF